MSEKSPKIVRTTTLELTNPPHLPTPISTKSGLAIMRATNIPLSFYRYLYREIGAAHYWYLRNNMDDNTLARLVHSPQTHIKILYIDGAPAGYGEFDHSSFPASIKLDYFGLIPQFIGMGIGKWFLGQIIQSAWELSPKKLLVSTDTFDHPHALSAYQKLGFTPITFKDERIEDWLQNQA